jgi:hypothetical protein
MYEAFYLYEAFDLYSFVLLPFANLLFPFPLENRLLQSLFLCPAVGECDEPRIGSLLIWTALIPKNRMLYRVRDRASRLGVSSRGRMTRSIMKRTWGKKGRMNSSIRVNFSMMSNEQGLINCNSIWDKSPAKILVRRSHVFRVL